MVVCRQGTVRTFMLCWWPTNKDREVIENANIILCLSLEHLIMGMCP